MSRKKVEQNSNVYQLVASNIKYYRKLRKLTQGALAEKTGYSHEYIRRIEAPNIKKNFSIDTISNIASALDIDIKLLFDKREKDK